MGILLGLDIYMPQTQSERYFTAAFALLGACVQATVFGSVAVLIAGIDAEETSFRKKVAEASAKMRQLGLPPWLRKRVTEYLVLLRRYNLGGGAGGMDGALMTEVLALHGRLQERGGCRSGGGCGGGLGCGGPGVKVFAFTLKIIEEAFLSSWRNILRRRSPGRSSLVCCYHISCCEAFTCAADGH